MTKSSPLHRSLKRAKAKILMKTYITSLINSKVALHSALFTEGSGPGNTAVREVKGPGKKNLF